MPEVHQTNILQKCCRICAVTAPKSKIRRMNEDEMNWFSIETNEFNICNECSTKALMYQNNRFEEVQKHFGLQTGLIKTVCTNLNACWFCDKSNEWKKVKKQATTIIQSDSQRPKKKVDNSILKKFFLKRMNQECSTIALEPFYTTDKETKTSRRHYNVYRILFHGKQRDFLWDSACKSLFTYSNSSWTGLKRHLESKSHKNMISESESDEAEMFDLVEIDPTLKKTKPTPEMLKKWRSIIIKGLFGTGKLAPNAVEQPLLRKTFSLALAALGLDVDPSDVLPSRSTATRMIDTEAYDQKQKTKNDIQNAIQANPDVQFSLLHDDGTLKNGNAENMRTYTCTWIDKDGCIQKRYLKSIAALEKDTESMKSSILDVAKEFNIDERYIFLTDAARVNLAVADQLDVDLVICGPHTLHNAFKNGLKDLIAEDLAFARFFGDIKSLLGKVSRKHLNHRMMSQEGWRKMNTYVDTRWCSLIDCLYTIDHNWDYLTGKSLPLIENHPKKLIQEFYQMALPFKYAIITMETNQKTSGQIVAIQMNELLIFYINYSVDPSKPAQLQRLASHFVNQLEKYMDGVLHPFRQKRICSIRILQTAFYLPSGYLDCFNVKSNDPRKQDSLDLRYHRLKNELNSILENHKSLDISNQSRRSSFGDTELAVEIRQFSMLATKYIENSDPLPPILQQFQMDEKNKKDANLLFWHSDYAKDVLPSLRKIVVPLLAVSASTSAVEGTFSFANHIRTATRSKLNTKTLDNYLTCLYSTFDL